MDKKTNYTENNEIMEMIEETINSPINTVKEVFYVTNLLVY